MSVAEPLVAVLERICTTERVVTQSDAVAPYQSDSLVRHRGRPMAVVFPESADEVRQVVVACHRAGVPWVSRGAGTGLSC